MHYVPCASRNIDGQVCLAHALAPRTDLQHGVKLIDGRRCDRHRGQICNEDTGLRLEILDPIQSASIFGAAAFRHALERRRFPIPLEEPSKRAKLCAGVE